MDIDWSLRQGTKPRYIGTRCTDDAPSRSCLLHLLMVTFIVWSFIPITQWRYSSYSRWMFTLLQNQTGVTLLPAANTCRLGASCGVIGMRLPLRPKSDDSRWRACLFHCCILFREKGIRLQWVRVETSLSWPAFSVAKKSRTKCSGKAYFPHFCR